MLTPKIEFSLSRLTDLTKLYEFEVRWPQNYMWRFLLSFLPFLLITSSVPCCSFLIIDGLTRRRLGPRSSSCQTLTLFLQIQSSPPEPEETRGGDFEFHIFQVDEQLGLDKVR